MSFEDNQRPCLTEEQLLREIDLARQEFFESIAAFDNVISDIPSRLPQPDGVQRIRNVARQRDTAYAKYRDALERLSKHSEAPKRRHLIG
jgi:hypothetical protein